MKPRTSIAISVLATAIALSFGASAAPDTPDTTRAGNPQETAPSHAMPRHSHVAEKLGVPVEQMAPADDKAAKKDKTAFNRHNHQRDMK